MGRKNNRWPANKRTATLRHVDSLIEELASMLQYAEELNSSERVHLKRALKSAQHVRGLLNNKRTTARQWQTLFESVMFILEASKKIYSLFINYILNQENKHELWNNNKVVTYC